MAQNNLAMGLKSTNQHASSDFGIDLHSKSGITTAMNYFAAKKDVLLSSVGKGSPYCTTRFTCIYDDTGTNDTAACLNQGRSM